MQCLDTFGPIVKPSTVAAISAIVITLHREFCLAIVCTTLLDG